MTRKRFASQWRALGFDTTSMPYLMRTAIGACLAMALGVVFGLEHPQWAAMSVWATSQPFRGQAIEKGLFRFGGSIVGAIAGVLFVIFSHGSPLYMMLMVAAWSTLCVGMAHLQRSYMTYGWILAGYTAAMVGLLDFHRPEHIFILGIDRLETVALGVLIATISALLFAPRNSIESTSAKSRQLAAQVLAELSRDIIRMPADEKRIAELLSQAALMDDALDGDIAGVLKHRRRGRAQRRLVLQLVSLIGWISRPNDKCTDESAVVPHVDAARLAILNAPLGQARPHVEAAAQAAHSPQLKEALTQIAGAMGEVLAAEGMQPSSPPSPATPLLHKDWVGAREAAIRTGIMMLLMGTIWTVTGWSGGPYLMLGASIMTTVFSVMDAPVHVIRYVFRGVLLGVAAAFICRWAVWPAVAAAGGNNLMLAISSFPFILAGPLIMSHRRTEAGAFDYNMHMLLLLPPLLPLSGTMGHWAGIGGAIILGPAAAWVAYRFIFPASLERRLQALSYIMVEEVRQLARGDNAKALKRAAIWRSRLDHRVLRLTRWIEKVGHPSVTAVGGGIATLLLGEAALRLHDLSRHSDDRLARSARLSLNRISTLGAETDDAEHALYRTANMDGLSSDDRHLLMNASEALKAHGDFFKLAAA